MHYRNVTMHLSLIGTARETTWSTTTEAPTLVLQLFQNKLKTTLSKQHLSIHKLHHTESKWATKFTGSAQKLPPPPPPPQAMQGPGAVPNLLPSTCRASAGSGSARAWLCITLSPGGPTLHWVWTSGSTFPRFRGLVESPTLRPHLKTCNQLSL